jgi:hypothetical protein
MIFKKASGAQTYRITAVYADDGTVTVSSENTTAEEDLTDYLERLSNQRK